MTKAKHIPIRTCVACRETSEKRQLLRIVRQPDGSARYDPKGKLSGRGAYVCARVECIGRARKQKSLERSLKMSGLQELLFAELNTAAYLAQATTEESPGTQPTPSEPLSSEKQSAGNAATESEEKTG